MGGSFSDLLRVSRNSCLRISLGHLWSITSHQSETSKKHLKFNESTQIDSISIKNLPQIDPPNDPKSIPNRLRRPQDRRRPAKDTPRPPQDGPRPPQEAPKIAPKQVYQNHPFRYTSPRSSEIASRYPKRLPRGPKRFPRCPQETEDAALVVLGAVLADLGAALGVLLRFLGRS